VHVLLAMGGDVVLNAPNAWGRPPIFSAAGGRNARKATLLSKLLSDARASVDWHDANGRGLVHHVTKRLDARLEMLHMLLTDRGCSLSDRDRFGNTPLMHLELKLGMSEHAQGPREGTQLVRDYLRGHAVCAASVKVTPAASVTLRLHVFRLRDASVESALPVGAVRAAGLVIFRRAPRLQYLLVQSATGSRGWTPSKGVCERGETEIDAAYRETREEAGLMPTHLRLLSEEPIHRVTYFDSKTRRDKVSVYFAAELINSQVAVRIGDGRVGNLEIADYVWLPHDAAKERAKYEEMKEVLDAAAAAINAERAVSPIELHE
jgi:bis(5'-nucleosidyl)-tetraphosphatase